MPSEHGAERPRHDHRHHVAPPRAERQAHDQPPEAPPPHLARALGERGEVQGAERTDGGRFRRGRDAEQDHREHHERQHAERYDGGHQLSQDLQPLTVHAPVVHGEEQDRDGGETPEPRVKLGRRLVPRRRRLSHRGSHLLGGRVGTLRLLGRVGRLRRRSQLLGRLVLLRLLRLGRGRRWRRRQRGRGSCRGLGRRRRHRGGRRIVDHEVPPRGAEGGHGEHHRHESDEQASNDRRVADRTVGSLEAPDHRRPERRGDEPAEHAARRPALEAPEPCRHGEPVLVGRQAGRDLGIDDRPAQDVHEIEERQEEARQHGRRIELDDRLPGHGRVDDQHHRRRDQDAERAPRRDRPRRQPHVVARVQHRPQRDHAHQDHDGADDPRRDAPERAHEQRRHGQRGGHAAERELDAVEHAVDERRPLHHVAHEDEQGDRQERVVGHDPVGPLDHEVEDPVVVPVLGGAQERDEPEEHPEAHERERRREAHHDRDHDEPEHQEPEGGIAHAGALTSGRPCRRRPCGDAPPRRWHGSARRRRAATPRR